MARSWRSLSWREIFLLMESTALVVIAAPAIRILPFRYVGRIASIELSKPVSDPARRDETIRRVRWAVGASAKRSPFRAMCIEQGLVAQLMLRRRGIDSTMYYGVAPPTPEKPISAHVWVKCGDVEVVGGDQAPAFALLATFPQRAPSA